MLKEELDSITQRESEVKHARQKLEAARRKVAVVPDSPRNLRAIFQTTFDALAMDSYEFADALRKIIRQFSVYLVRLCDGGHLMPRAKLVLALDGLVPDMARVPGMAEFLRREITIDLFEPPQRERIRKQVVEFRGQEIKEHEIAERIAEKPTITTVQTSMALHRMMLKMGLKSPYLLLTEPPEEYRKLRRHKHLLYQFTPAEGYQRPPLQE